MMRRIKTLVLLAIPVFGFQAVNWHLPYPESWPKPEYDYIATPLDSAKIALGRQLFYDPLLSRDSTISCESCHSPFSAFTHVDHALSHGIDDRIGTRNAPALFNLAWHKNFMWDGLASTLRHQNQMPISHPDEMDMDMDELILRLRNETKYKKLFYEAFGDSTAQEMPMLEALSQFQLSLISANSKYDQMKAGKAIFSPIEEKGYNLYKQLCSACHTEPLFSTYDYADNGLTIDTALHDIGHVVASWDEKDSFAFKIPSLRNVEYSFPYMHDGRFATLYQVLDHYANHQPIRPNVDSRIQRNKPLSPDQKTELLAFLLTLSDSSFIFDRSHWAPR